jgi:hypothetical protein
MWAIITLNEKYPNSENSITFSVIVISVLFFSATVWWVVAQNYFIEANVRAFGNLAIAVEYPKTPDGQALRESNRLGVYKFVRNGLKTRPPAEVLPVLPSANSPFKGSLDLNRDDIYLRGWSFIPGQDSFPSRIYLVLKKDDLILKLETAKYERPDVSTFFGTSGLYDYSGYEAYPRAYNIPPGTYSLGILVENVRNKAFQWQENETIVIP